MYIGFAAASLSLAKNKLCSWNVSRFCHRVLDTQSAVSIERTQSVSPVQSHVLEERRIGVLG